MKNNKKIFINYRRKDARGLVDKYYQCLRKCYGDEIFFDESGIQKGDIIPDLIKQNIASCRLFLAVIGPNWDEGKHLNRLHQPDDWVRQELELAKAYGKRIIPVFIDRDDPPAVEFLPESLKSGIFDRNAIKLSEDDDYWDDEIRRHQEIIKQYTDLKPAQTFSDQKKHLDEEYRKLTYCLDRNEERKKIEISRKSKVVLLSASGTNNSCFDKFAEHFSIEGKGAFKSLLPGARVKQLVWEVFSESSEEERKIELCKQIMAALSFSQEERESEKSIELLQNHFKQLENGQRYVFYVVRRGGSALQQSGGAVGVWHDTWHALLGEKQKQNVMVFLFTIPGWLQKINFLNRFHASGTGYIGHFEDNIKKEYIDSWHTAFTVYLQNADKNDRFDRNILEEKLEKHFAVNQTVQYKKAIDELHDALTEAYRF